MHVFRPSEARAGAGVRGCDGPGRSAGVQPWSRPHCPALPCLPGTGEWSSGGEPEIVTPLGASQQPIPDPDNYDIIIHSSVMSSICSP